MSGLRPPRLVTYRGKTQSISAWARERKIPLTTLRNRLDRGWTPGQALRRPSNRLPDLTGKIFGELTVCQRAPNRGYVKRYVCACSCGAEITVEASKLVGGQHRCGSRACKAAGTRENDHKRDYPARQAKRAGCEAEWIAWDRITRKARREGIEIAPEWKADFWSFLEDVGTKPDPTWWLAREDKAGAFDATNCGWLPPKQACRTRRSAPTETEDGGSAGG